MKRWAISMLVLGTLGTPGPTSADAASEMAQFGRTQLKRRQEGTISQEQHLRENMAFIKHSAEKRLELLSEQMGKK